MQLTKGARRAAVAVAVAGSLGAGGVLLAATGGTAGAATPPSGTTAPAHPGGVLRRAVDGTVQFARGTVGTYANGSLTVDSPDGTSLSGQVTSSTKFHNTTSTSLSHGDRVGMVVENGNVLVVNAPKAASSATPSTPTS
jgi:hypothetical protein